MARKDQTKKDGGEARIVPCVCTVECAWDGIRSPGERVGIREDLLRTPFFAGHFKAVADGGDDHGED